MEQYKNGDKLCDELYELVKKSIENGEHEQLKKDRLKLLDLKDNILEDNEILKIAHDKKTEKRLKRNIRDFKELDLKLKSQLSLLI